MLLSMGLQRVGHDSATEQQLTLRSGTGIVSWNGDRCRKKKKQRESQSIMYDMAHFHKLCPLFISLLMTLITKVK